MPDIIEPPDPPFHIPAEELVGRRRIQKYEIRRDGVRVEYGLMDGDTKDKILQRNVLGPSVQLQLLTLACSVLDPERPDWKCPNPARWMILPGPTGHCEEHGIDFYKRYWPDPKLIVDLGRA